LREPCCSQHVGTGWFGAEQTQFEGAE